MAQQTHEPSSTKEQIRQTRIQKLAEEFNIYNK